MRKRVVVPVFLLEFAAAALVWFPFLFFAYPVGSAEAPPQKAAYAGDAVCKACHAPQFEKFSKTIMGKIFVFNPRNDMEKRACESCHGPGSEHVAKGGGKGVGGMITYRKGSGESVEAQNESCLQCHKRGVQTYWEASAHAARGVGCVDCHTIMEKTSDRFQLAKVGDKTVFFNRRAQTEVCNRCHLQRKAQLQRSSHMPLREGKITCADCHNPHGTPNPAQLKQTSVNENCYSCHAERRGPYLHEHQPVLENCSSCHEAHGSVNDRLLVKRMPRLCQQCHVSAHRATDPATQRGYFNRSCANCHSQIHGSNHPAGFFFTR